MSERRVAGAIMSLFNVRDLQLEWARVLHEALIVLVLMYGGETMLWKEKERYRIRAVHMDNVSFRRMDRIPNGRISELCGVKKGLIERINESVLR